MKTRIVAGVLAAIAVVGLIFYGPPTLVLVVVLALTAAAYWEFDQLMVPNSLPVFRWSMAVLSVLGVLTLRWNWVLAACYIPLVAVLIFSIAVYETDRSGDFARGVHDAALRILGLLYIRMLFGFLLPIAEWPDLGRQYVFLLCLIVFVGDTAAYFGGYFLGRKNLAPKVSPKKTVEGSITAVIASLLVTAVWLKWIYPYDIQQDKAIAWFLFTPFASLLAQLGDLFESVLKRSQSQKDSGTFLPGHGGLLDRVDGLALITPVFYLFLHFVIERSS